jgi:hypothetical protein
MSASQSFSGTGDPNGAVVGNPGDVYQDQTGGFWVNTAAPSTWTLLSAPSPTELGVSWSQSGNANFTAIRIVRGGGLCGFAANLSEAVTVGELTAEVTRNGVGTGLIVSMSPGSHPSGDVITRAKNVTQFFAGDEIGVQITSTADFAPNTCDILCTVDVIELVAA